MVLIRQPKTVGFKLKCWYEYIVRRLSKVFSGLLGQVFLQQPWSILEYAGLCNLV